MSNHPAIAVVGAGHAGVEAAFALAKGGAKVTLFSDEPCLPYFRPRLIAVAFGQAEPDAIARADAHAHRAPRTAHAHRKSHSTHARASARNAVLQRLPHLRCEHALCVSSALRRTKERFLRAV